MSFPKFLAALAATAAVTRAAIPEIEGFTLTWGDDFQGAKNAAPSEANWLVDVGTSYPGGAANWGTGEIQTYTNDRKNLALSGNGQLQITAIKDSAGAWTSGRIETQRKDFMAQPGGKMRIQASLNLPNLPAAQAVGYWPAFWTLGAAFRGNFNNWPSIGEFDIMENVNSDTSLHGTLHCGTNPGGPCNETTGVSDLTACTGCQGAFNTYTFEVDRTQSLEALRWFFNGKLYHQIVSTDLGAELFSQVAHNPHFILMNLAIGGSFPNNVHGSTTPLESTVSGGMLQAEYVAVYNSPGTGATGSPAPTATTSTKTGTATSAATTTAASTTTTSGRTRPTGAGAGRGGRAGFGGRE